jgi:hypothetical protein
MKKRVLQLIGMTLALLFLLPVATARAAAAKKPQIEQVRTEGAIVHVMCSEPMTAYCITTKPVVPPDDHPDWRPVNSRLFSAFKSDGVYYVRVRNAAGMVSDPRSFEIRSGFHYVIEAEGQDHLTQPIGTFLESHGDSIEAFNKRIAESAIKGGLYSRTGVANVCMRFMSDLADYNMTLSYQPRGDYQLEEDWGVSPSWGKRFSPPEQDKCGVYRNYGMNCGTILIWAYKQAGLNIGSAPGRRGIYDSGMLLRENDNKRPLNAGDTCDLIATKTGHTMMILDRVDTDDDGLSDSYLVLEMESPYLKLKLRSLYSVRLCTLYDMSAVFDDTGWFRNHTRRYTGSFRINRNMLPDYYRLPVKSKAVEEAIEPRPETAP